MIYYSKVRQREGRQGFNTTNATIRKQHNRT